LWSPERIHDQLVSLGMIEVPAPNTIAKYLPSDQSPPREQAGLSWQTFLANHRSETWAMDFFTVPTMFFKILYVLVVISHERRVIKHIAVSTHPTAAWVVQQLREATPFGDQPAILIHDNDSVFCSAEVTRMLRDSGIRSVRTSLQSPWQNGICERTIGTLRRELTDHVIPLNQQHLQRLLTAYVGQYYNPMRTHQGIGRETPLPSDHPPDPIDISTTLESEPILGGLYHRYRRAA